MLIVAEAEMLKSTSEAKVLNESNSKVSMDIDNGDNDDPEKIFLPNGKGSSKMKIFDRTGKGKASSRIIPCVDPNESICFFCQLKGHWKQGCPKYLKDLRDTVTPVFLGLSLMLI